MDNIAPLIESLTGYDFVILAIFILLIIRGLWHGAIRLITDLVALFAAYFVASQYNQEFVALLQGISDNPKVVFLTACISLFLIIYIAVLLVGKLLRMVINLSIVGWFDRLLGGAVGALQAAVVVVLMQMLLGAVLAPENDMLRKCKFCTVVNSATDVSRQLIRDPELRKSLLQNTPAISLDSVKTALDSVVDGKGASTKKEPENAVQVVPVIKEQEKKSVK